MRTHGQHICSKRSASCTSSAQLQHVNPSVHKCVSTEWLQYATRTLWSFLEVQYTGAVPGLARLEDILKPYTNIKCPHNPPVHHFWLEDEMYPGKPCQLLSLTFDGGVVWHHFLLCLSWFLYSCQLMWFSLPRTGSDAEAHKKIARKKKITFRQVGRAGGEKSRKPSAVEIYIEQRNKSELERTVLIMAVRWKILHREDSFCMIYASSWC